MQLGFIIQARSGSTRLPRKMLLPFYSDKTILDILLQRINNSFPEIPVVLATSVNPKDKEIENIAKRNNVISFRGSEDDVLQRFIDAAKVNEFTAIIRICADNPFLSMAYLKQLFDYSKDKNADYISYKTSKGAPTIKTHFGFWTEYITLNALERIKSMTDEKLYHEHVTNYAYTNPNDFICDFLPIEDFVEKSGIRLTVDTAADFANASKLYAQLLEKKLDVEPKNIIPLVDSSMKQIMEQQIHENSK